MFLFLNSEASASKICYFSLNNQKEFTEMEKFTKKLNNYSKEKIEIQEFQTEGESTEKSFQKMVESGVKCDGLVISGHHTGSFGGKRGSGQLDISFMEKLSCLPEHQIFFQSVKALWLQACRTLGVAKIEADDNADFHAWRVEERMAEDHLTQSVAQLNREFAATLDQANPLSSRYLRIFPRANTFGWTKTAPGEKFNSEYSIPYHIAQLAKINDSRGAYFDNPVGEQISLKAATGYALALNELLKSESKMNCSEDNSSSDKKYSEAWLIHGSGKGKYTFNNPDLNAYGPLFNTDNQLLKRAKELECAMRNSRDHSAISSVIDEIIENEALIGYSFNSIYEYMQRLDEEGNFSELGTLRKKLKASPLLQNFLMSKLSSPQIGIIGQIDFYVFYKKISGEKIKSIEEVLNQKLIETMLRPITVNDYAQHDFRSTLSASMAKHGLVTKDTLVKIIASPKATNFTLTPVAFAIRDSQPPLEGISLMLKEIIASPKATEDTLNSVAIVIRDSQPPIEDASFMLRKIMASPKISHITLASVASAIGYSQSPLEGAPLILKEIITSPKASSYTLHSVAFAIKDSRTPLEDASLILKEIIASPKATEDTLNSVESAIKNSETPIENGDKLLEEIKIKLNK